MFPGWRRRPDRPPSVGRTWALLAAIVLGTAALRLPHDLSFGDFAFGDRGGWLTVQYLAAHGLRPDVDFSYFYGLLPILVGRLWFGTFGLTPIAFEVAVILCGLAVALAMARFASVLRLNPLGVAILAIGAPIAIPSSYYSLAHGLEAVLLSHALAGLANGRRAQALALATAACFAKPAMGYVFGFFILIAIAFAAPRPDAIGRRRDYCAALRELLPAVVTGALLAAILAFAYGVPSLLATILPGDGIHAYHALGFGLFNQGGRDFYDFPGVPLIAYLGVVVPFWFLGGIWLAIAGVIAAIRLIRRDAAGDDERRVDAIVVFCAGAHLMAACVMFGGPTSWMNYAFLIVMGVAASATVGDDNFSFAPVAALALIALIADLGMAIAAMRDWRTTTPAAETAGLWASPAERGEWRTVERLAHGHRTIVVSVAGAAPLIFPNFAPPVMVYLLPGDRIDHEIVRLRDGLKGAEIVVTPVSRKDGDARRLLPWLGDALADYAIVWRSADLAVLRNPRPVRPAGG